MKKSLVLTGMMGVGKTKIGRLLAKRLLLKFIDVDKVIEKNQGKSIKRIFEENGEPFFREIEERITLKILKKKRAVIALGGGAFMNNQIRLKVLKSCTSIWLKVNLKSLIKRYKKNDRRPLLNTRKTDVDLKKMYELRKKIYRFANFRINCDNMRKSQVVDKILFLYEN